MYISGIGDGDGGMGPKCLPIRSSAADSSKSPTMMAVALFG